MIATLTDEQQADATRREHIFNQTTKGWNRRYGHSFPDLMAGLTPAEATKYPDLAARVTQ